MASQAGENKMDDLGPESVERGEQRVATERGGKVPRLPAADGEAAEGSGGRAGEQVC